jgi:hypothetical protein
MRPAPAAMPPNVAGLAAPLASGQGPLTVPPTTTPLGALAGPGKAQTDATGLVDFDALDQNVQRAAVVALLNQVPAVPDMQTYLKKKRRKGKPHARVRGMDPDPDVPAAAWTLVLWIIGSCTAHLEELTDREDLVQGVGMVCLRLREAGFDQAPRFRMEAVPVQHRRTGDGSQVPRCAPDGTQERQKRK